jgi:uncharacterized membrane protein YjjB (DUF3815 family)
MIEQLVTSFVGASAFGVLFNAPKNSLIQCGFAGMIGWCLYITLVNAHVDPVLATLAASCIVTVISQICARVYQMPIIVFSVSGVIPLVPGGLAYDAMRKVVENDYNAAIQLAAKAFVISGAIAIGLVFSEVINQISTKIKNKPN